MTGIASRARIRIWEQEPGCTGAHIPGLNCSRFTGRLASEEGDRKTAVRLMHKGVAKCHNLCCRVCVIRRGHDRLDAHKQDERADRDSKVPASIAEQRTIMWEIDSQDQLPYVMKMDHLRLTLSLLDRDHPQREPPLMSRLLQTPLTLSDVEVQYPILSGTLSLEASS